MMKLFAFTLFFMLAISSFGQQETIRKYFDSSWQYVPKEKAFYYSDFFRQGVVYKVISYYAGSNNLYGRSTFADTLFRKGIGTMLRYYETGELKDSTLFDSQGFPVNQFTFRKNGKIHTHTNTNKVTNVIKTEEYDENGKINPLFTVIQVPAEFDGGIPAWTAYLEKHIKSDTPAKNKAPVDNYTVIVLFVINEVGKVIDVSTQNDPGYGTKEEAIRVIQKSPKWKPATQNGKPVLYRHKQSITFQVSEK